MQRVALCFGRDRLRGIADLFAAIKYTPPFFDGVGDFFAAAKRNDRRGRADLALDEQTIHHAPKEHDGNADGLFNKHAVGVYGKGLRAPGSNELRKTIWKPTAQN